MRVAGGDGARSSGEALRSCMRFETRSTQRASMSSPSLFPVKPLVEAGDALDGAAGEVDVVASLASGPVRCSASSLARLRGSTLAGRIVSHGVDRLAHS